MSKLRLKHMAIFGLGALALLAMGCIGKGYAAPKPDAAPVGLNGPARQDCGQIAGTAFRSDDERTWFLANCSKWPETNFDSLSSVRTSKPEDPACTAQRGKPYLNEKDRQWFLANCNPTGPNGTPTASSSDPVVFADSPSYSCAPGGANATPTPTRGSTQPARPGASPTPGSTTNCVAPAGAAAAGPTPAPGDRTDCYAISGTPYRSKTEEAWYVATCLGGPAPQQPGVIPAQPVVPGGSPATQPPPVNTQAPQGFQLNTQNYYCNPANPGYPNARGRVIQPC